MAAGAGPLPRLRARVPAGRAPGVLAADARPRRALRLDLRGAHVDLRRRRCSSLAVRGAAALGGLTGAAARRRGRVGLFPLALGHGRAHALRPLAGGPDCGSARRGPRGPRARSASPFSGSPSPQRSTRSSSFRPLLVYVARRQGGREAALGFGAFVAALAVVVLPFAIVAPEGLRRLGGAAARPSAPDREPRRLAPARSAPARALRPGRRLLVRLAEPRRLAAGRARRRPDRAPGGGARRRLASLRARPGDAPSGSSPPARPRSSSFVAFGKVLSPQFLIWLVPRRPAVGGTRRPRGRRSPRRGPRDDAALVPDALLGPGRPRAGGLARARAQRSPRRARASCSGRALWNGHAERPRSA